MDDVLSLLFILAALAGTVIYFLPTIAARNSEHVKWVFLLNLLGAWTGLLWVGAWLLPAVLDARQRGRRRFVQGRLLELARQREGRIAALEAATSTGLELQEVKRELERLREAEVATLEVTPEGTLVYAFSGWTTAAERAAARDPLDVELPD